MDRDDPTKPTHSPSTIELCLDAYAPYLADTNLSETEKQVLIEALWNVICGFVELGFGVSPISHVHPCGKLSEKPGTLPVSKPDLLYSTSSIIENFVTASDDESAPAQEGDQA